MPTIIVLTHSGASDQPALQGLALFLDRLANYHPLEQISLFLNTTLIHPFTTDFKSIKTSLRQLQQPSHPSSFSSSDPEDRRTRIIKTMTTYLIQRYCKGGEKERAGHGGEGLDMDVEDLEAFVPPYLHTVLVTDVGFWEGVDPSTPLLPGKISVILTESKFNESEEAQHDDETINEVKTAIRSHQRGSGSPGGEGGARGDGTSLHILTIGHIHAAIQIYPSNQQVLSTPKASHSNTTPPLLPNLLPITHFTPSPHITPNTHTHTRVIRPIPDTTSDDGDAEASVNSRGLCKLLVEGLKSEGVGSTVVGVVGGVGWKGFVGVDEAGTGLFLRVLRDQDSLTSTSISSSASSTTTGNTTQAPNASGEAGEGMEIRWDKKPSYIPEVLENVPSINGTQIVTLLEKLGECAGFVLQEKAKMESMYVCTLCPPSGLSLVLVCLS
ncbi:hypothetical protein HK102_003808 [Quaeritorhiza haematococci]|nr:hypothetical protein HK102_003808 [Quaeritorhiza haematococci]